MISNDQKGGEPGDLEDSMEDEESKNKANRATRLKMGCEGRVQNKLHKRGEARLSRMLKAGGKV